jgi:preprotein translocase subunit SecE
MKKIFQFFTESKAELKKVVWPKKDEVIKSTGVVVVVVIFISLFLFVADQGIEAFMNIFWK